MPKDTRPWIKVSVDMWRHPKITQLTAAQFRTLIALWSLAMEYRTDGALDVRFVRSQGLTMGSLRAIADTGLGWFSDDESVFHLHDYLDHQSSAEQLEAKTNQRRSAGRRGGLAKAESARSRTPTRAPSTAPPTRVHGPHPDAQVQPLLFDEQPGQDTSGPSGPLSGPLSDTRGHARAAEVEEEKEHLPPNAAAASHVTREPAQQPQPSTHFADGTAIPPEPPNNDPPATRGALALVHDADAIPTEISADHRRTSTAVSDTARTLVRYAVPTGIPRQIRADLAEQVQRLANDRHVNRTDIETGLREWAARPGAGPRLLPNLVADAARARTAAPAAPKSKLRTIAELAAQERAHEQQQHTNHQPEITP